MLFHVDIGDEELASIDRNILANVTTDLLRARRLGNHLIVTSRRSAKWLRAHVDLSARDRAMLGRLEQEYSQTGSLRGMARVYVELTTEVAKNLGIQGNAIFVSLSQISQYRILDRPILLIEDIASDGTLFNFLLHNHCNLHGCNHLAYDLRHGGGENLVRVFEYEAAERKITCAIVDSDKNYPLGTNSKLAHLRTIAERMRWPFAFCNSPPCRESENMIPFGLVIGLPSGHRNNTNAVLSEISRNEAAGGRAMQDRYVLYFDLKEGLSNAKLANLSQSEQEWIASKLKLANVDAGSVNLSGYGERIVRQLCDENKLLSELKRMTREQRWRQMFAPFIDDLIWPLAASLKLIT